MYFEFSILWLTENYPPQRGGMAVSCDRIVRSLREKGVRIDLAHFSRRYRDWRVEKKFNGQHFSCPVREDIAHTMNRLWSLIENKKEENHYTHVVAFGGLLPMIASPVFSTWMGVPLITMIRGNDFDAGIFSLKRGDILREALKTSSCICAVSKDKVEKISALYPQAKIEWTPNGIDLTDWEFSGEDISLAKKWRVSTVCGSGRVISETKPPIPADLRVLGFFGQLKRKKGSLFFLESLLRSGHASKFHLLFVGDAEEEMLEWLEANKEEVHFTFLPFLDRYELLPYYASCDMIVIPSFYDGMPNVLLEAAALGIPAIATTVGGMRDVLENKENAFLFSAGDEHDCRVAIESAATASDEELKRLGANCIKLAKNFSHQKEAERYLDILRETK